MDIPNAKNHVKGTYQVAVFLRRKDGSSFSFASDRPLDPGDPIALHARETIAVALNLNVENV